MDAWVRAVREGRTVHLVVDEKVRTGAAALDVTLPKRLVSPKRAQVKRTSIESFVKYYRSVTW